MTVSSPPSPVSKSQTLPALFFSIGLGCTLLSFAFQNVTMATQNYDGVLTKALSLTGFAMICWAVTIWRGNLGWRVGAIVMILMALWIFDYPRTIWLLKTWLGR